MKRVAILFLALAPVACVTPSGSPLDAQAAAVEITEALQAGDVERAEASFEAYADRHGADELVGELYAVSESAFSRGDAGLSADVLDLIAPHAAESPAVQQARVYALFTSRASAGRDPLLGQRLEAAIEDYRAVASGRPGWVDLAEAQAAIDRGDVLAAESAFSTFREAWTGYPRELEPYVLDIERYLDTQRSGGTR